ncbi:MAG: hypothetical protein KAS12_01330 [Candidatus Aenigmarchaeota archaeon]|nr:hypothetical protein [Candidatus Aenigmarchaeota archaeon]
MAKFQCEKCEKIFKVEHRLIYHQKMKTCQINNSDATCDKCGKIFPTQRRLMMHLNRKTPCELIVGDPMGFMTALQCPFCLRTYKTDRTLNCHVKICPVRIGKITELREKFDQMETENEALKQINETLKQDIKIATQVNGDVNGDVNGNLGNTKNTNCHNTIYTSNTTNIIKILNTPGTMERIEKHIGCPINCFDQPNIDYINKELVVRDENGACYAFGDIVKNFARELYANLDHPENHSVLLADMSRNKLVALRETADDGKMGRKWCALAVQELCKIIKNKIESKFDGDTKYNTVQVAAKKRAPQKYDNAIKGLADSAALIENGINKSTMLKLEISKPSITRLLSYNLNQYEPKLRVKKLFRLEWGKETIPERRNIYLKEDGETINKWNGIGWSFDLLDFFTDTMRNFCRVKDSEISNDEIKTIAEKGLIGNRIFLTGKVRLE